VKLRRQAVPFRVLSVEPRDGARAGDEGGAVCLRVETLHGGRALVLQPTGPLDPGREHRLRVRGLRDARGREAPPLEIGFTTGPLAGGEIWP